VSSSDAVDGSPPARGCNGCGVPIIKGFPHSTLLQRMSPLLARCVGCGGAAIWSLPAEKRTLRNQHKSVARDPERSSRRLSICAAIYAWTLYSITLARGRPNARPALIYFSPEHPSGFRIDQVLPRANRACDRLISLVFAFGRIVSDPALHVQTGIRAAVDKWWHRAR